MTLRDFVDAHVHFWNLQHPDLYWEHLQDPTFVHPVMGPQLRKLAERNYEAEDYISETRNWNVTKAIHVQAAIGSTDPVKETQWLQRAADRTGFPHGIVAHADLRDPTVEETLSRHCDYPNVRGIRDFSYGDYLESPDFHRGFALLEKYNLIASLDVKWQDMDKLRDLAQRFPDTWIVLDHAGFPTERSSEYMHNWRKGIITLASSENIVCKLSGFGMSDNKWSVESIRPLILHCIDNFGVDRVVFASNWPVDSLWSSYGDVRKAHSLIIADFSAEDQQAMLSGNAERLYRI